MKKFLIRISFFILLFIAALCLLLLINRSFSNFKTVETKNILVIGDSHSECAFNDNVISGLVNFSLAGESYFYSYFKIKKIINQNPNIKIVLIEISNNQVTKDTDRRIWGDKYLPFKFPVYGPFMDLESVELLIKNNPTGFKNSIFPLIKSSTKMIFTGLDYSDEIGGYHYLKTSLNDTIKEYDAFVSDDVVTSDNVRESKIYELQYLRKIIKYVESKGLKVFLVRSPLNKNFKGFKNEKIFKKKLTSEFSDVEFLDFANFPLANEQFADLSHLNYKGAELFSSWFDELLHEGLFDKQIKQSFIDRKIKSRLKDVD